MLLNDWEEGAMLSDAALRKNGTWQVEDYPPTACLAFPLAAQWVHRVAAAAAADPFTDVTTSVSIFG